MRSFAAAGAALIFAAVELLSPVPEFHRHANEFNLTPAGVPAGFVRDALPGDSGSGGCPACAISGMSALAVSAVTSFEPSAPNLVPSADRTTDPAVVFAAAFDGRAPPLA